MKNMSQILDIENCSEQKFTLFNREIVFSSNAVSFTNLFDYFNNLGDKYKKKFLDEYSKCEYIENDADNFRNTLEITTQLFDEVCREVNELWILSNISPKMKNYDSSLNRKFKNRPVELALHMPYADKEFRNIVYHFSKTTIGKMEGLYAELKSAKLDLEINEEYRHAQKNKRSRTWVGGGFGFSGAVKGALAAGFLNLAEDGLASLKSGLENSSARSADKKKINDILKRINGMYASDMKLLHDIDILINLLLEATIICANEHLFDNSDRPFSYNKCMEAIKGIEQYSSDFQKEQLIKSIQFYPFASTHYKYIERYFAEEIANVSKLKNTFLKMNPFSVSQNLDEVRKSIKQEKKRNNDAQRRWGLAHELESSGNIYLASKYYLEAYHLNPNDQSIIEDLKRLNITPKTEKKVEDIQLDSNQVKEFEWYKQRYNAGDNTVIMSLADCYHYGRGTLVNIPEAINLYTVMSNSGNGDAFAELGLIYGKHDDYYDSSKAVKFYQRAWELGTSRGEALARYGVNLCHGIGINANLKLAFQLFAAAAKLNDFFGQYNMARCYAHGIGIKTDYNKCFEYLSLTRNNPNCPDNYKQSIDKELKKFKKTKNGWTKKMFECVL